ncbi:hypothetical protein ACIQ9P_26920 [Kitasatospora sp. NPDC094019]|uniref:hypothetical protein n=1 Tax=Kitasatospora sp. NPDC094019 TaxID=3364091 RepID=UPI00382E9998
MSNRRGELDKVKQFLGLAVFFVMVLLRPLLGSGVPATWRLRRIARSKTVRQAAEEAQEQLSVRLATIARAYELRPVLTVTTDTCERASRGIVFPNANRSPALTAQLKVVAYFAPSTPPERAVPELIERLPPPTHGTSTPQPGKPGPHHVFDGHGTAHIDWDIPGTHTMTAGPRTGRDRHTLRRRISTTPADTTLEQARTTHGPLVAWTLCATYHTEPTRR